MVFLKSGLFRKFVAVLGALALVPVVLLGLQLTQISRQGIQAAVLELHTKLAEKLAQQIDEYFKVTHEKVAFALASLQKRMEWEDKQQLLRSLIETHADIVEISMLNRAGVEVLKLYNPDLTSQQELASRAGEEAYLRFLKNRSRTTMVAREPFPALHLYYPLSESVTARVLVSLKRLGSLIAEERVGGTGFAVVVDERGDPLLYPEERLPGPERGDFKGLSIVSAALQAHSLGSSEFVDGRGRSYVGAYAPVYAVGSAVVILQSRDEAYGAARRMRRAATAATAGVAVLCLLAATILARRLTRPLLRLSQAAEAVARGDFLSKVDIATRDELQDLAETFNRMTAQLRSYSVLQVDRLIAEQRKTEAILYSINDGILMVDQGGRVQHANRRALEIFGLNPLLSIEGRRLDEAVPESKLREALLQIAAAPNPESFRDVNLSTEASRRYIRFTAHPVVTPGRTQTLGIVVGIRDVTLERELDRLKEEFLHYITHDLRNPLGSAMGFLDVLHKGTAGILNPDQQSIAASIKRSLSRLMGMVNNILDIAKMESGRIKLNLKTVSLAGIAGRSMSILESLAKAKKIAVRLDAAEEFSLGADSDLLERVFVNLLGNAIKYTPEGGSITLSLKDEGASVKCCVEDTGEGIPAEYLGRIFEKFEQVTGQRRGGTGLGLTIAKFFVESHLGSIWVESEPGKGSRFYFTIPKNLCLDREGGLVIGAEVA